MKKSLLALAIGTLALGISEFVMMGTLPQVAAELGVSIVRAGYLISAYAIGVCVGAPLTVLVARKLPPKRILYGLLGIIVLGNGLMALTPGYGMALGARFISGLPHGAFFGVGSIVAERVADRGKTTAAVATMIAGMTFANLVGVPLGTYISNSFSWRIVFALVCLTGIGGVWAVRRWVPRMEPLPDPGLRGQFAFLKSAAPWLILFATMVSNTGIFSWYSYVSPSMTDLSGFCPENLTAIMTLAGLGMVVGNFAGGRMSDRHTPYRFATFVQLAGATILVSIFLLGHVHGLAPVLVFGCTAALFGLSAPQQLMILQNAPDGKLLGAALIQVGFNLGNALGAWLGGLPVEYGLGYEYSAAVGIPFALTGFALMVVYWRKYGARE